MRRMWSSVITTVGIGAALYGLSRYRDGKYMEPVRNMMGQAKDMVQNAGKAVSNPLMEMSEEIMPNQKMNKQNDQVQSRSPMNPS